MKNKSKILILIITVFVLFTSIDVAVVLATDVRDLTLNVPIGNLTKFGDPIVGPCTDNPENDCTKIPWIAQYIGAIYYYGLRLGAMFAVLMMIIGGLMYLTAGVNPGSVSKAKGYILSSLFGLVILFGSYLILYQVNPDLARLPSIEVEVVKRVEILAGSKWCEDIDSSKYTIAGFTRGVAKCGDKFKIEVIQAGGSTRQVAAQKECVSNFCKNEREQCVMDDTGKFGCRRALIWGTISGAEDRYVDNVRLVGVQEGDFRYITSVIDVGSGKSQYFIPWTDETVSKMNKYGQIAIEVELNDSGRTDASYLTDSDFGQEIITWVSITNDDVYYMARIASDTDSTGNFILGPKHFKGVWVDYCDDLLVSGLPCTAGGPMGACGEYKLGENQWTFGIAAKTFNASDIIALNGIQVDINSDHFWEDADINCAGKDSIRNTVACNDCQCFESEFDEGKTVGELKCIQVGDDIYKWSDGKIGSNCANILAGNKQCAQGTCKYITPGVDSTECTGNSEACWGACINLGVETANVGDVCSEGAGAGSACGKELLESGDVGAQLVCYEGRCQRGAWGDACTENRHCNSEPGFNFYCNKTADTCSKVGAKAYQNCDPSNLSACGGGLTCSETGYLGGSTDIDFNMCMIADLAVDCENDSDCSSGQYCNIWEDNYCSMPIAGARCGAEGSLQTIPQGYRCNSITHILYRESDQYAD